MLNKYVFLGTGTSQGVPVISCDCKVCGSSDIKDKRLRTSLWISNANTSVVIDAGPDFRQQMLRHKINKLDAIVFTHEHMDHLAGLDDVRAYNFYQKKPMKIYATKRVQQRLREQYSYIFNNINYPGIPQIEFISISDLPFTIGDIHFNPIALMHANMPVLGFRMGDFTYITDANYIAKEELEKLRGSKVLVLNALKKQKHHSHFSLSEAIDIAKAMGVKQAYFTHISHQMGLHQEVNDSLDTGMALAYDNLEIHL